MEYNSSEFGRIIGTEFPTGIDDSPYGATTTPAKPGLTKRGKAALAIGATVIAGGALIAYQSYSAQQAAQENKAQEIALQQQRLELERMKETNRINAADKKTQSSAIKARQASVDACVKSQKDQVGKVLGVTYHSILEDCQTQYPDTATGTDLESAAATNSSNSASSDSSGGGVNTGLLLGGGVLAAFVLAAAKKGTRSNAT